MTMTRDQFWREIGARCGVSFKHAPVVAAPRASARPKLPSDAELRAAISSKARAKPKAKPRRNRTRAAVRQWIVRKEDQLEQATNPHARRRAGVEKMEAALDDWWNG